MRSASAGPISPRSTPAPTSSCAYFTISGILGPNSSHAATGGDGTATGGSADRKDDHSPVRVDALGLAAQAGRRDGIVHYLPLERVHRAECLRLAGPLNLLRGAGTELAEIGPATSAVAADVEHQPGPPAGLPVHRQPGQFLQRVENLAAVADQLVERSADDGDDRAVAVHVHVDVAVEIGDIEQPLDVVGRYLALELEVRDARLGWLVSRRLVSARDVVARRLDGILGASGLGASGLGGCLLLGVSDQVLTMAHDKILLVGTGIRLSPAARNPATLSACPSACYVTAACVAA